jgi:hypothetical protein
MIIEYEVLLMEQPTDQRRFAIIDRATGEETQGRTDIRIVGARKGVVRR